MCCTLTLGPQYTSSGGMTSGLVGPPTMSLVGPPPPSHSQAPLAQRYPHSVPPGTSEVSTTNYPPGSQYPSYGQTQPPLTLMVCTKCTFVGHTLYGFTYMYMCTCILVSGYK